VSSAQAEWLTAVRKSLVAELSRFRDGWNDEGELVIGPGTLAVRPALTHDSGPGHVDLGFILNRERSDAPVIWDCVAGGGAQDEASARVACSIWAQTTAPVIMELLTQQSKYADHAHGDDGLGLAGWHSIHGAILGYGRDDASSLQQWCLDHPVVPALRDVLAPALTATRLHGVKFLLGAFDEQSVAEVRIDGVCHDSCSAALVKLPWPKAGKRVTRLFVLFIHPENQALES
jgi:hypothetical protein